MCHPFRGSDIQGAKISAQMPHLWYPFSQVLPGLPSSSDLFDEQTSFLPPMQSPILPIHFSWALLLVVAISFSACSASRIQSSEVKSISVPQTAINDWKSKLSAPDSLNPYQQDALYLLGLLQTYYPFENSRISTSRFELAAREWWTTLQTIEQASFWRLSLQYFLASLQDGHSRVADPLYDTAQPLYGISIRIAESSGKIHLLGLDSAYAAIPTGIEITGINGFDPIHIRSRIDAFHSGTNPFIRQQQFHRFDILPDYWRALQLSDTDTLHLDLVDSLQQAYALQVWPIDTLRMRFVQPANPPRFPFAVAQPQPFFSQFLPQFNTAYLQVNTLLDSIAIAEGIRAFAPPTERGFAEALLQNQHAANAHFGRILNRFFTKVEEENYDNIVIDLRQNRGGDERLGLMLLRYLDINKSLKPNETYFRINKMLKQVAPGDYIAYQRRLKQQGKSIDPGKWYAFGEEILQEGFWKGIDKPTSPFYVPDSMGRFQGNVYVLIGPETFSAAATLAALVQDNRLGILIGSPAGDSASGPTGSSSIVLPNTGTVIHLSYAWQQRAQASLRHLDTVIPDLWRPQSLELLLQGKDPALEAALGL